MRAVFTPGLWLVGRLSRMAALSWIAFLYLSAQLLSLWWAAEAAGTRQSLLENPSLRGPADWQLPAVLLLFIAATYMLMAYMLGTRMEQAELSDALARVANGEVAAQAFARPAATASLESTPMWRTLERMGANLAEIVGEVRASARAIAQGAAEMADGYSNLSRRTEAQASTLEQTASGMQQLEGTVERNAASARSASSLADSALALARQGAEAVLRAANSMAGIQESARRMADMTASIEAIAVQTNLLALNAAVEAARAGGNGRGFAVVAAEVRALAQRSSEAAKQIKSLIGESAACVVQGAADADAARRGMDQMVQVVGRVDGLIAQVTAACGEQHAGLQEMNKAILQLESVTQQNSALVEQAAASALGFEQQAGFLLKAVDAFKLDRTEARAQAVALVKKAAAHLSEHAPEQAFRDFHDPDGEFMFEDYYIFVLDSHCFMRANGAEPESCGTDHSGNVDADGKRFSLELLETARTRGAGWVDYRRLNRKTRRIEPKSSYVERVGDFTVGCGIYRPEVAETVHPAAVAQGARPRLAG